MGSVGLEIVPFRNTLGANQSIIRFVLRNSTTVLMSQTRFNPEILKVLYETVTGRCQRTKM